MNPTRINDLALSLDINKTVAPVLPKLDACLGALKCTTRDNRTWGLAPLEIDEPKARACIRESIETLRSAITILESAGAMIDTYDKGIKTNYGQWLRQIVGQSKGRRYELNGAKSLKACTKEQLEDIALASVFLTKYEAELFKEVKEAGLGISTLGSLVLRYIADNHKAVYEDGHIVHHLTPDNVETIRKLQTLLSTVRGELSSKKMDREREAEKAEKQVKKQKMNQ